MNTEQQQSHLTSASGGDASKTALPEGCTPADARVLREACFKFASEEQRLRKALRYYADKCHFMLADDSAWDTVSGEPSNFWCDEAGTATIEDGSVAAMALRGVAIEWGEYEPPLCPGEPEALIAAACEASAGAVPSDKSESESGSRA